MKRYPTLSVFTCLAFLGGCEDHRKGGQDHDNASHRAASQYVTQATAETTQGANRIATDSPQQVWRFAIFPDTQGRDDDNMAYISRGKDGRPLDVSVYHGYDYNQDGIYDGEGFRLNVSDPYNPYIETDASGRPIAVTIAERQDFPQDFKIIPDPLVAAITDKMIELDVDLVLATGDITEFRTESDYVMWMDAVAEPLRTAGIDVYPVRGNHEVVNGRNWQHWFSSREEPRQRQSVDNVANGFSPYEQGDGYDQGLKLYQAYAGTLLTEKLARGEVTGFPGAEDLNYFFIHRNTLFIGIDFYFADLLSNVYGGTWLVLADWLKHVITTNAPKVDHIVVFGHEPFATKKRPQRFDVKLFQEYQNRRLALSKKVKLAQSGLRAAQNALNYAQVKGVDADIVALRQLRDKAQRDYDKANEEFESHRDNEPKLVGTDMGQLGFLLQQDKSRPGLAQELLELFTRYQVNYIAGHDHQYARSMIHSSAQTKSLGLGFTQIIGGSGSWKAYESHYGVDPDYETGLFIDNYVSRKAKKGGGDDKGYRVHTGLGKGISFVLVEINGRQISTTSYVASHDFNESDMNLGLRYDKKHNCWQRYAGEYLSGQPSRSSCVDVSWKKVDQNSRTSDGLQRLVAPYDRYWAVTSTPADGEYIGSSAAILDGYNLTFDSVAASKAKRLEMLSELFTLSWFVDKDKATLSDVLLVSGNSTQVGAYRDAGGDLMASDSPSERYLNRIGQKVDNTTYHALNAKTEASAETSKLENKKEGKLESKNMNPNTSVEASTSYHEGKASLTDAIVLSMSVPAHLALDEVTIGRYDEGQKTWLPAFENDCFIATGYSEHFSAYFPEVEQVPEGEFDKPHCRQFFWGYNARNRTVWGFVHTDGQFAVIRKE